MTVADLITAYHAAGAKLASALAQVGSRYASSDNGAVLIYVADPRSPTGVSIAQAWRASDAEVSGALASPTSVPVASPAPTATATAAS